MYLCFSTKRPNTTKETSFGLPLYPQDSTPPRDQRLLKMVKEGMGMYGEELVLLSYPSLPGNAQAFCRENPYMPLKHHHNHPKPSKTQLFHLDSINKVLQTWGIHLVIISLCICVSLQKGLTQPKRLALGYPCTPKTPHHPGTKDG